MSFDLEFFFRCIFMVAAPDCPLSVTMAALPVFLLDFATFPCTLVVKQARLFSGTAREKPVVRRGISCFLN